MSKIIRFLLTFSILMLFWFILTLNFQSTSILIGIILSFFVSMVSYDFFLKSNLNIVNRFFQILWYLLLYIFVLVYEMFLASFDVLYRVISNDINPEVVYIKSELKSDLAILLLSNSITLTPGTITIDVEDEYLYVHWLYARTTHFGYAANMIKGRFEKWLERIFEER